MAPPVRLEFKTSSPTTRREWPNAFSASLRRAYSLRRVLRLSRRGFSRTFIGSVGRSVGRQERRIIGCRSSRWENGSVKVCTRGRRGKEEGQALSEAQLKKTRRSDHVAKPRILADRRAFTFSRHTCQAQMPKAAVGLDKHPSCWQHNLHGFDERHHQGRPPLMASDSILARDRTPQQEGMTPARDDRMIGRPGENIRKRKPTEHATNTQPAKKQRPLNKTHPDASQRKLDYRADFGGYEDASEPREDGDGQPSTSVRTPRATAGSRDADEDFSANATSNAPRLNDASLRSDFDVDALDEEWFESASPHFRDQTADHRLGAPKCSSKPWHSDPANIKASGLFMTADERVPDKPTIMKQWVQDQHYNSRTTQGA